MECSIFSEDGRATLKALLREILREISAEAEDSSQGKSGILDASEAAAFLKIKLPTLYEKTSARSIPHFKKGNKLYFYRAELEQWLIEGKVKTADDIRHEALNLTMNKQKRST